MSFFENTRRPEGFGGKLMVSMMNLGHAALAEWGLQHLAVPEGAAVLDCGCGGGANIKKLLEKAAQGSVKGIDYSEVSVEKSRSLNALAISAGRCEIMQANVAQLPFEDNSFDLVTAFETVYFWPELPACFREVGRVLRPGGTFFICNECGEDNKWTDIVSGLKIYTADELTQVLTKAGFTDIVMHKNDKGWLCATARK
ncbi:MAG TPA: SAM-dependent methyltransferase [Clostridiales bacterium]|nr:SAM-dependent methyltransferase [Clostridiales bacterium]